MNDGMVNAISLSGDHAAVASAVTAQTAAENPMPAATAAYIGRP